MRTGSEALARNHTRDVRTVECSGVNVVEIDEGELLVVAVEQKCSMGNSDINE
ncbi:hypothetical protein AVEN_236653-1, partial [Araneus ventricosus]